MPIPTPPPTTEPPPTEAPPPPPPPPPAQANKSPYPEQPYQKPLDPYGGHPGGMDPSPPLYSQGGGSRRRRRGAPLGVDQKLKPAVNAKVELFEQDTCEFFCLFIVYENRRKMRFFYLKKLILSHFLPKKIVLFVLFRRFCCLLFVLFSSSFVSRPHFFPYCCLLFVQSTSTTCWPTLRRTRRVAFRYRGQKTN